VNDKSIAVSEQRVVNALKHHVFQNGGWCASAEAGRDTYIKYGPSTACKADGKGGPWANQVYEIVKVGRGNIFYILCNI